MRYAFFSDIHGNLAAFEKVIKNMRKHMPDKYICLGDVVGYGPQPVECLERAKEISDVILMGNHDEYVEESKDISDFNPHARASVEITRDILKISGNGHLDYLKSRLYTHEEKSFQAVHANIVEPFNYGYILERDEADKNFLVMRKPLLFTGHSHHPMIWMNENNWSSMIELKRFHNKMGKLNSNARHIVNVGSVGQPRDGNERACYVIYDDKKNTLGIYRVVYDIKVTENLIKTLKVGGKKFPERNAKRLYQGK